MDESQGSKNREHRSWLLIKTLYHDPATCLYVTDSLCIIGTLLGRVTAFVYRDPFESIKQQSRHASQPTSKPHRSLTALFLNKQTVVNIERPPKDGFSDSFTQQVLASFSNDSICYVWKSSDAIHALLADATLRTWPILNLNNQTYSHIDPRLANSIRYVLPYEKTIYVGTSGFCTLLNTESLESVSCPFRLLLDSVIPCCFNGTHLGVVAHYRGCALTIKIYQLPPDDSIQLKQSTECVLNLPLKNARSMQFLQFWAEDFIVFSVNGYTLLIYSWKEKCFKFSLKTGPSHRMIAVDTSQAARLITLSCRGQLTVWAGSTGKKILALKLAGVSFSFDYPRMIRSHGPYVFFTADQGCHVLDLGELSDA